MPDVDLWPKEEIEKLMQWWPTLSASQIANRLGRTRSSVCGKMHRLVQKGLAVKVAKQFDEKPARSAPRLPPKRHPHHVTPPPQSRVGCSQPPRFEPRPCTLYELDETRCHWPLGDINAMAELFCGGVALKKAPWCAHHAAQVFDRKPHTIRKR